MILGLVAAALEGATADEEIDCFISPDPIPFAPPRTLLPTPLYPRRWPEVGVVAGLSAAASLAGEIGLVRGEHRANQRRRRRRRRAKVRGRQEACGGGIIGEETG